MSLSAVLVFTYIFSETLRGIYAYKVFANFPQLSPSIVVLSAEISKLLLATIILYSSKEGFTGLWNGPKGGLTPNFASAVPAVIYLVNQLIYLTALPRVSPSLLGVCILAKLPITGILHHYMVRKQKNVYAWVSLFWICVGIGIFNIKNGALSTTNETKSWYIAPLAGFIIACLSALASIYNESLTKRGGFWESQAWLYFWGVFFAATFYAGTAIFYKTTEREQQNESLSVEIRTYIGPTLLLVALTAGVGIVVAVVLRIRDNLLKLVGTSATIVSTTIAQYFLIAELRRGSVTPWKVFGGGLLSVATWCYSYYQHQPWKTTQRDAYSVLRGQSSEHVPKDCSVNDDRERENIAELGHIFPGAVSGSLGVEESELACHAEYVEGRKYRTDNTTGLVTVSPEEFEGAFDFVLPPVERSGENMAPTFVTNIWNPDSTKVFCLMLVVIFFTAQTSNGRMW